MLLCIFIRLRRADAQPDPSSCATGPVQLRNGLPDVQWSAMAKNVFTARCATGRVAQRVVTYILRRSLRFFVFSQLIFCMVTKVKP